MITVGLDVMGGDFAPQAVIDGALIAAKHGVAIHLFGTNLSKPLKFAR